MSFHIRLRHAVDCCCVRCQPPQPTEMSPALEERIAYLKRNLAQAVRHLSQTSAERKPKLGGE